jgi:hypothetical protein
LHAIGLEADGHAQRNVWCSISPLLAHRPLDGSQNEEGSRLQQQLGTAEGRRWCMGIVVVGRSRTDLQLFLVRLCGNFRSCGPQGRTCWPPRWLCRPLFNSKVPSPTVSTPLGLQLPVFSLGWLACPLTAYLAVADRVRTRPWPASWGSTPRASAIGAAPAASAGSMPAAFYQGKCSVHGRSRSSRARPGILHAGGATSSVSR